MVSEMLDRTYGSFCATLQIPTNLHLVVGEVARPVLTWHHIARMERVSVGL